MSYPKRIYTDVDIEEVTYQDFNRIETGIETNDVRLTSLEATSKSHSDKLVELGNKDATQDADISKRVLQTTYNTKMSELDAKNLQQDNAIATKVPLDQYATDKSNLEDSIMQRVTNEEYTLDKNTMDGQISQLQTADAALQSDINRRVLIQTYTTDKAAIEKSITDNVAALKEKNASQDLDINSKVAKDTYATDKAALERSIAEKTTTSLNGTQTNVNLISSGETVESVNGKKFASNTDIVTDSANRPQEAINRVFYKNMCKEFTSNGEPIVVNNGMDGYVLSGKIEGQTVKRISPVSEWIDLNTIFNSYLNKDSYNASYILYNFTNKPIKVYPRKWVDDDEMPNLILNSNEEYLLTNGYIAQVRGLSTDGWNSTTDRTYFMNNIILCSSVISSPIPFGLSSTQAVMSNNGIKYSF